MLYIIQINLLEYDKRNMPINTRLAKIQKKLRQEKAGAVFITDQYNVSYLTGFSGLSKNERESFLLVTIKRANLFTFPTYFGLYKKTNDSLQVFCLTQSKRLSDHLNEFVSQENIKRIGFESENLTVAELSNLQKKVRVKWHPITDLVENERIIKDDEELNLIRRSARITDQAYKFILTRIKRNVSEKTLALELEFFLKKKAGDIAFSPIVAFNENAAIPHYLPAKDRRLKTNSLILLDFGARVNGYCSDMTRVVFLGTPSDRRAGIYRTVLRAQQAALKVIKPGLNGSSVDQIARDIVGQYGSGSFLHGLGHGVGLAIHESPRLKPGSRDILKENMVVTVEPGIYLEGEGGVRIEDLVVLKPGGIEILSTSPKPLTIL